ncbi:hypothetical protein E2C01_019881 [Portunus trituberculatus]|uniref:Uncharacterized protein n=1 Tax=Portunus trituberculatus TaxID=210409 RepID=A0A5B7DZU6_PORTR|nr:hypothetical protein [Portunus trituberculatus]
MDNPITHLELRIRILQIICLTLNIGVSKMNQGGVEEDVSLHQHTVDLAMRHSTQQRQPLIPHLIPHFLQQTALRPVTSDYEVHLSRYKNCQNTPYSHRCSL